MLILTLTLTYVHECTRNWFQVVRGVAGARAVEEEPGPAALEAGVEVDVDGVAGYTLGTQRTAEVEMAPEMLQR